jgi:phosphoglycerol transferase MdoB-like AlkP superfamily enzyme
LYQYTHYDNIEFHNKFLKEKIDGTDICVQLKENKKPNIILIFAEGLSAEVLDVYNNLYLDLTPNLNKLFECSLVFNNYYNHTAATYRGLRGQMISGYQFLEGDWEIRDSGEMDKANQINMVSLVDILNSYQYSTYFINSEPSNIQFSKYLETFNFNDVISGEIKDRYLSDKEVFTLLLNTIFKVNEPFFIGLYNIGTHHGQNSPDIKYADGNNHILNRFHNFDAQFGIFFDLFMESGISDNTILIFTTDHATFPSPEYKKTFKSEQKYFVNNVPLFFYWQGVEHKIIDAHGRNSLDLIPTILDILNINNYVNYFLGSSLFLENAREFSTITAIAADFYSTKGNKIEKIVMWSGGEEHLIKDYYKISGNYKK